MSINRIPPAGTIGVLGGGPMGRLIASAASTLGYRVRLLETDAAPPLPAAGPGLVTVRAARRDVRAAIEVARGCDVLTVASEDVPEEVLTAVAVHAPLRPGLAQLGIAQERQRERTWLGDAGFPVMPWRAADTRDEMVAAAAALGPMCVIKPRTRRHASFRPLLVTNAAQAYAAWNIIRGTPAVVERAASIAAEVTVLVARSTTGEVRIFPAALGVRDDMRLAWSVLPATLSSPVAARAARIAADIAERLGVVGLLAAELFLLNDGSVVVNEIAPAPHPTYYAADEACATGQCEQLVRAITGLPLGDVHAVQPSASMSVLAGKRPLDVDGLARSLEVSRVRAHVHDTGMAPEGTPIAFLYAVGESAASATTRLLRAHGEIDRKRTRRLSRRRLALSRQLAGA